MVQPKFYLPPYCVACGEEFDTIEERDEHHWKKHRISPTVRIKRKEG